MLASNYGTQPAQATLTQRMRSLLEMRVNSVEPSNSVPMDDIWHGQMEQSMFMSLLYRLYMQHTYEYLVECNFSLK